MRQRSCLEAGAERPLGGGPDLVRPPALEQLRPREREPEVRSVELVGRAEQHVDARRGDVDRRMRCGVDGVDPRERTHLVRQLTNPCDVDQRPDRVGGPRESDHARALGQKRLEVVEVDRRVVAQLGELHPQAEVLRQLEPGRDVAVVIELRDDDLVAGAELASNRPRQGEVERRHVRAEDDLLRAAAEKGSRCPARLADEQVAPPAGLEGPAEVRVRLAEIAGDRLDDLVRNLRPAGPVEEHQRPRERRETRPHRGDVERDGAHRSRR